MEQTLGRECEGFDFRALLERARRRRETVEELHLQAAAIVFPPKSLTDSGERGRPLRPPFAAFFIAAERHPSSNVSGTLRLLLI
jgi:hypothetical protein